MLAGNIPGRTQTMPIAIFSAVEGGDMRGALLWVILIVVISLAIIRLLNRSGEAQRSAQRRIPVARDGPRVYPQVAMSRPDDAAWLATLDLDIESAWTRSPCRLRFAQAGARLACWALRLRQVDDAAHDCRDFDAGSRAHCFEWPRSV